VKDLKKKTSNQSLGFPLARIVRSAREKIQTLWKLPPIFVLDHVHMHRPKGEEISCAYAPRKSHLLQPFGLLKFVASPIIEYFLTTTKATSKCMNATKAILPHPLHLGRFRG
jgi:hypothetical protein